MKIVLTVPGLSVPHGGIRIIIEWANRLSANHQVVLLCRKGDQEPMWIKINSNVSLVSNINTIKSCDTLVICSPHDIDLAWVMEMPKRKFVFLQMLEHLFRPWDQAWMEKCNRTYGCHLPLILISQWNREYIEKYFHCHSEQIHMVGNGVNLDDFPVNSNCKKDGKTILVEGWESGNPSKDDQGIGPLVAGMLRADGYRILAYGQLPLRRFSDVPHEYYQRPHIETLNSLYERSTLLLKASRYDARSCAPMEAMTKGCITVRAISKGDDDLIHDVNCLRVTYGNKRELYKTTINLLNDSDRLTRLRNNCIEYVQKYSWGYWMPQIERILTNG